MGSAEGIVRRLRPFGETRQPAFGAQRADAVAPPGQDFMRIALVADVPDDLVPRGTEHGMERHRQLHHTKPRTQMAARHRHRRNRLGA